jgi:hypothetical protein
MVLNSINFCMYLGFMSDGQSDIARRGVQLSLQVHNRSVEHGLSQDRYRRRSLWISVVGAAAAATAGASLLSDWPEWVAILGFLSALLALLEPVFGYAKQAEAHRVAESSWGELGTSYYNLQYLSDREQQLKALQELTLYQERLAKESVSVEKWAIRKRESEERRKRELEERRRRHGGGVMA